MKNNYDNIARHYDWLSRLIFRRSQMDAQIALLPYIDKNSAILIVGGGTGWILEELARIQPAGLHIVYVEISAKMIALARQRNYLHNSIDFIHLPIENFVSTQSFDALITPFLFDNFPTDKATSIFTKLHDRLKPGGKWLFTDFVYTSRSGLWQWMLLKIMYLFFRIICQIEASTLTNMQPLFSKYHYSILFETFYFKRFIRSVAYRK
jgi:ubiquinone/menaquinone biosynthesis C-methylase UbiE